MNALETAKLCRIITSLNPAQRFDEETPTVWHAVLVEVALDDALESVKRIARRSPWISAADICAEVRLIRRDRLRASAAADELVPNVDPDDIEAFKAERLAIMRAAADGSLDPEAYAASGRTLTGVPPRRAIGAGGTPDDVRRAIRAGVTTKRIPDDSRSAS